MFGLVESARLGLGKQGWQRLPPAGESPLVQQELVAKAVEATAASRKTRAMQNFVDGRGRRLRKTERLTYPGIIIIVM